MHFYIVKESEERGIEPLRMDESSFPEAIFNRIDYLVSPLERAVFYYCNYLRMSVQPFVIFTSVIHSHLKPYFS